MLPLLAALRRRDSKPSPMVRLLQLLALTIPVISGLTANAVQAAEAGHGMVVSVSAPASQVGIEILKKGGNAVDAAVATAFALAVTYPQAGNLGGGGFMLVYPGGKGQPTVFEYRETAPAAATKNMLSNDDNEYGHKVVGVPGTVRGLAL